jgi:hypothetical protein
VQKAAIGFPTGKIPAAAQQQRLVQRVFETPVPLLDIAVLVCVRGLDLLPLRAVVIQQPLVAPREVLAFRQVVHGGAQPIGPMPRGHITELPDRVLITLTQALETL